MRLKMRLKRAESFPRRLMYPPDILCPLSYRAKDRRVLSGHGGLAFVESGERRSFRSVFLPCFYLWGTCQMVSAYSATARSAAKMPERAMLCRLISFHFFRSP